MTIIEPHKIKYPIYSLLLLLAAILAALIFFGVYLYNQNVEFRHAIRGAAQELQEQRIANADYKNRFYQILDSEKAKLVAKEKGLIPEKNPEYLASN